jgi:hypothetical protein
MLHIITALYRYENLPKIYSSILISDKEELRLTEEKLFYLNRNVSIVEEAMVIKENEIFEFLVCDEFCLN